MIHRIAFDLDFQLQKKREVAKHMTSFKGYPNFAKLLDKQLYENT